MKESEWMPGGRKRMNDGRSMKRVTSTSYGSSFSGLHILTVHLALRNFKVLGAGRRSWSMVCCSMSELMGAYSDVVHSKPLLGALLPRLRLAWGEMLGARDHCHVLVRQKIP